MAQGITQHIVEGFAETDADTSVTQQKVGVFAENENAKTFVTQQVTEGFGENENAKTFVTQQSLQGFGQNEDARASVTQLRVTYFYPRFPAPPPAPVEEDTFYAIIGI